MLYMEEKQQLLDYGKRLYHEGFIRDMQGNLSILVPQKGHIVITPSAIPYDKRKLEDLCILDMDGNLIEGDRKPTSEFALHTTLYKKRKDLRSIIHTHPIYCSVFAIVHEPIVQVLSEVNIGFSGTVPVAPYACPGTQALGDSVADAIGPSGYACIMANHGMLSAGKTIEEACHVSLVLEDVAKMIILGRAMGGIIYPIPPDGKK